MRRLPLIDTHTGGEATRVLFHDDLESLGVDRFASLDDALRWLRSGGDWIRRSILLEPRGCESMVGAWIGPPANPQHLASVVFFNNADYLGMCGHGLIGIVEAMRYRDKLSAGTYQIETVAGVVTAKLRTEGRVEFDNVPSDRYRAQVHVEINAQHPSWAPSRVVGDIAYGGNWFFLVPVNEVAPANIDEMTRYCVEIRRSLGESEITGRNGAAIDHIELCGPADETSMPAGAIGGRGFVLCPGGHYDRSPCGTGTSAKIACLAADNDLQAGQTWIQQSVIGSEFAGSFRRVDDQIVVTIIGRAHVTAETVCIFDSDDPLRFGIQQTVPCPAVDCPAVEMLP